MNFVLIGNGESRKPIDIDLIKCYKIGCNYIYRFNKVDEIMCVDHNTFNIISKETDIPILTRLQYTTDYLYYYNGTLIKSNILDRGFCSGIVGLECLCNYANCTDTIYMIGFDFFYSGSYVNHIYKGLGNNYYNANSLAISTDNFYCQAKFIWNKYNVNYVWVGKEVENLPAINRLTGMTVNDFLKIYKDL